MQIFTKHPRRIAPILLASLIVRSTVFGASLNHAWPPAGHGLRTSRNQNTQIRPNTSTVGSHAAKWTFTMHGMAGHSRGKAGVRVAAAACQGCQDKYCDQL